MRSLAGIDEFLLTNIIASS